MTVAPVSKPAGLADFQIDGVNDGGRAASFEICAMPLAGQIFQHKAESRQGAGKTGNLFVLIGELMGQPHPDKILFRHEHA